MVSKIHPGSWYVCKYEVWLMPQITDDMEKLQWKEWDPNIQCSCWIQYSEYCTNNIYSCFQKFTQETGKYE